MIEIKFLGFPAIYDYLKKDHIWHTFSGRTLKDLIDDLFSHYGEEIRESLWDERIDELDPTIQIKVNEKYLEAADPQTVRISENDSVTFFRLLAGG